jgi:hypothetical protein
MAPRSESRKVRPKNSYFSSDWEYVKSSFTLRVPKIVIYERNVRRHFSHMSTLFDAQATKERVLHLLECIETSSRIEVCTIFFETNISIFKLLPNSSQFSE